MSNVESGTKMGTARLSCQMRPQTSKPSRDLVPAPDRPTSHACHLPARGRVLCSMLIFRPKAALSIDTIVGYLLAHNSLSIGRRNYRMLKDRDDFDMTRAASHVQCRTPVYRP